MLYTVINVNTRTFNILVRDEIGEFAIFKFLSDYDLCEGDRLSSSCLDTGRRTITNLTSGDFCYIYVVAWGLSETEALVLMTTAQVMPESLL